MKTRPQAVTSSRSMFSDPAADRRAHSAIPSGTGWPAPVAPVAVVPRAGISAASLRSTEPGADGKAASPGWDATAPHDRSGTWLRNAAAGLALLAGASAAVSFTAQYRMVDQARGIAVVAGLEAAIPDAAALVFACLGVALALHGRRAIRSRCLNVAAVGTSVFMNAIAAAPGWRGTAVWIMPPIAYALASDTLIGVVRTWVIARHRALLPQLAAGDPTPLAAVGRLLLWLLRLAVAPASTLSGFRAWVIAECPVAPGRRACEQTPSAAQVIKPPRNGGRSPRATRIRRPGTKTARFLSMVERQHGPLAAVPLPSVARICSDLAPHANLHPGAARTALRRAVLAAQKETVQ
jgi:hypothetical protein